ncbi:G-protein coupled receptor 54-like [Acanthaster planci]|uniref:G-protein coupled receptor 54-like n=1 Tax=Acanthaster planci TaxID=133434 RepID=A0A8B7YNS8_ACAPL|nr:G-protein coupled receptor 54-like [Acanthaster planci]XP_022094322.1 G-protein coupled receptor 54-like [Acanthaster planci]XP_022094329.1 G-protein coupled receptor 54-like [Acanthaster planci]XP_022094341.1 G-protein coupled receptor 54-like [Acanthaster planci]
MTESAVFVTDIATTVVDLFAPTNFSDRMANTNFPLLVYSSPRYYFNGSLDNATTPAPPASFPAAFETTVRIMVPTIIAIIAIIGLIGNGTVLYIIFRYREMQNITNYFIANLAVTDVAMLAICAIPTAANIAGMPIGEGLCKGINYMQFVTVQATCCTLTAMSIDRYLLIVHAVRSRNTRTTTRAIIINVAVWIGSFVVHSPVAIFYVLENDKCFMKMGQNGRDARFYYLGSFLSMYVIPLVVILMCYAKILVIVWRKTSAGTESAQAHERSIRQKRKITRMVFIVVLLFAVCWAPIHCMILWEKFQEPFDLSMPTRMAVTVLRFFAFCLSYANSLTNPFIYAFTTASFKKHFKRVLSCSAPNECTDTKSMGPSTTYKKIGKFLVESPTSFKTRQPAQDV